MGGHEEGQEVDRRVEAAATLARIEEKLDQLMRGFPGGDPDGHRRYHEAMIERANARTEFLRKLTFELAKWGLLGFAAWCGHELWVSFLRGPK